MMRINWKIWRRTSIDEDLSAHVDDALDQRRRAEIDAEIATSPLLRRRLEATRATVDLLRSADSISAPRSFALKPEQAYGPARPLERRGPSPLVPAFGAAAAALAVGLLLVGNLTGALKQSGGAQDLLEFSALSAQESVAGSSMMAPELAATEVLEMTTEKASGKEAFESEPAPEAARMFAGAESLTGSPQDPALEISPDAVASVLEFGQDAPPVPVDPTSDGVLLPLWQLELALALTAIAFGSGALVLAWRRRGGV